MAYSVDGKLDGGGAGEAARDHQENGEDSLRVGSNQQGQLGVLRLECGRLGRFPYMFS